MIATETLRVWRGQTYHLIMDIAAALGPDFILVPIGRERAELNPEALPSIRDEGGRVIDFDHGHGYTDEALKYLKISAGKWPTAKTLTNDNEIITPREPFDGIQVAWSRGPQVIAREIKRRFLPAYLLEYAKCEERAAKIQEFADATSEAYSAMVCACGLTEHDLRPSEIDKLEIYSTKLIENSYGHIQVNSADSVEFHLRGINIEMAVKIAAAIRAVVNAKEAEPCTPPTL